MIRRLLLLAMALAFGCGAVPALADKRVALVIGNSTYRNIVPLDNPKNDAALMARTLSGLGFTAGASVLRSAGSGQRQGARQGAGGSAHRGRRSARAVQR